MKNLFGGTFNGKTVLVTGHTGFKGGWLSLWLHQLGARVIGYALAPPTEPSLFKAAGLERSVKHITGDIRDHERLKQVMDRYRPEYVFHLAAQSLVRMSYSEPRTTYETNIMGTYNLLEAVRGCESTRVCQVITSDKCYQNREWVYSYRENDALGGHDPYSSSKACAEIIASAVRDSYFTPSRGGQKSAAICTARAGNVIGGGDWAMDRLIPDCVKSLADGVKIHLRNPHAIRPWQFVLEPLSGYLWLACHMDSGTGEYIGSWNFGPQGSDNLTVGELVEKFLSSWGSGGNFHLESPETSDSVHEATYLKLDCTKAINLLKWSPVYNIDTALECSASWYREFYSAPGKEMYEYSLGQIRAYTEAASQKNLAWASCGVEN